jgi:hypothetical protein
LTASPATLIFIFTNLEVATVPLAVFSLATGLLAIAGGILLNVCLVRGGTFAVQSNPSLVVAFVRGDHAREPGTEAIIHTIALDGA